METAKRFAKWFATNWERLLFILVGLSFFATCFYLIYLEKIPQAAVLFGLGFLSFIYANVARFKRFKGLGFEAELWEDKQKEAASLIERLRDVVSIYTREVILGKIRSGRWGASSWHDHWKLYNDLITEHVVLGLKIDFSGLKKTMDDYFLFDMTMPEINKLRKATAASKRAAEKKINEEFGSPIRDIQGHRRRIEQFVAIQEEIKNPFEISTKTDLAGHALNAWHEAATRLKQDFDVEVEIDPKVPERLGKISKLYRTRPVDVTDELIGWADREE